MKSREMSMDQARRILERLRDSDPDFRGADLELVVKNHRRAINASQVFVIVATSSLWDFPQHWLPSFLFFGMFFALAFHSSRQASRFDQIRQLFERDAPQNLDDLPHPISNQ